MSELPPHLSATAIAHPNIAFIKYWGNLNDDLRIPSNSSISMNLASLQTKTSVEFSPEFHQDFLTINSQVANDPQLERVSKFLDIVRQETQVNFRARVISSNNFPHGAGIASSASAFACLALAASFALGLHLDEGSLSRLARRGSGSACRSIPSGFVEWQAGQDDESSFGFSIANPDHWDLVDCVCLVETGPKEVGSTEGHHAAITSPIQSARVSDSLRRLGICRHAILHKDFDELSNVVELDSNLMHSVMMTSRPPLFYWTPASLELMKAIPRLRRAGLPVCYSLDAGPNVHIICTADSVPLVTNQLKQFPGVNQVLISPVGGPARLQEEND